MRDYGIRNPCCQAKGGRLRVGRGVAQTIQGYIDDGIVDFKLLEYTSGVDPSYFATPHDITPTSTMAWVTININDLVGVTADGAILLVNSVTSTDLAYGIRERGSTYSTTNCELEEYRATMYLVGLDVARRFDIYILDQDMKIYLVAQTKGSIVFYENDIGAGTHFQVGIGITSFNIWDEHMESTQSDVYIAGYTKPP